MGIFAAVFMIMLIIKMKFVAVITLSIALIGKNNCNQRIYGNDCSSNDRNIILNSNDSQGNNKDKENNNYNYYCIIMKRKIMIITKKMIRAPIKNCDNTHKSSQLNNKIR